MSGVEPGPNGTMILTGFVGHSCAAARGANKSAHNANATLLFIELSLALSSSAQRLLRRRGVDAALITVDALSQACIEPKPLPLQDNRNRT
jgi:hypothetical protein